MQKMPELPNKQLFRVDEAAQYFRRTKRTIYRWCEDGKLKHIKINGREILIPKESIYGVIRLSSDCYEWHLTTFDDIRV